MDVSERLSAISLDVKSKDHDGVLTEMSSLLFKDIPGAVGAKTFCDLKEHESMEGVLFGTNSAIFHCLSEGVDDVMIAVSISGRGIPHPKKKKYRINIFFLIVSPMKESGTHLRIMSRVEGFLLDRSFRHAVLSAKTADEVKKAVKREEGGGRSFYVPLSTGEVFAELSTSPKGLTNEEAGRRLKFTGPNVLKRIEKGRLLKDFLNNLFFNLFAVLLWAGGAMSFIAGMSELGFAIFLVIAINASFSFWQEYKAERAVEFLEKLLPRKVKAVREDAVTDLDAELLVPGDVLKLEEGDAIPSDGRLVSADEMRVDNSALTGESKPVYKMSEPVEDGKNFIWTEVPNLVFAGTSVLSGAGTMVVTATGMDTEIGKVAYMTQAIGPDMSPLQKEMARVTKVVTVIASALGILFFFLGYNVAGLTFFESFIFAIGIIVANVPEGLLPTVTLSLAMGVKRMAARRAIVKKLSAVETLGSTTVICTDKTGTLTSNEMRVVMLYASGKKIDVGGRGYEPSGDFTRGGEPLTEAAMERDGVRLLLKAALLCNNSSLMRPNEHSSAWTVSGDPTEGALVVAAEKCGFDSKKLREENPRLAHLPFERIRKRMTTVHGGRHGVTAFVKGSPKETLELCPDVYRDGTIRRMEDADRAKILEEFDSMASRGLRVLAMAMKPLDKGEASYTEAEVEKDLTFIGLAAMFDPPRPEVKQAIEDCKRAGIKVVMITGDYGITALSVGREIGLAVDSTRVVTGIELLAMNHRALLEAVKGDVVFARVQPKDKLRIVSAFQHQGHVVAVTGDGVNDAPALKKADIGIAMGLRGSDVAKESADMVLADDNFATIVEAIREGRAVYSNIKKFVTYIFASNIPEIVPFIAFVIFKIPLPLTVMQILAVDLGTDVLPALGLGTERPENGIMEAPPRRRDKRLLDFAVLARAYLFLGPIEAALCLGGFFLSYRLSGWTPGMDMATSGAVYATATTMSLAGIVASQIGNVFACRTERESVFTSGFFKNRFVLFGIAAEVALLLMLIYTPVFQRVFGLAKLGASHWLILAAFPFALLFMEEARKFAVRRFF